MSSLISVVSAQSTTSMGLENTWGMSYQLLMRLCILLCPRSCFIAVSAMASAGFPDMWMSPR